MTTSASPTHAPILREKEFDTDQIEMEDLPAEESGSECGSTAGKPSVPRQALWMGKPQSSRFPTKLHHVNKCTTTLNTGIQHYYRMHA